MKRDKGEGMGDEKLRDQDSQGGRGAEWGSSGREILMEPGTMILQRNLVVEKFPRIHSNDLINFF